jgi:putative ABC transport system permease protein
VALTTLAIGIGANTAIFSVLSAVLLRPLPFDQPEELVQIRGANPEYATERQLSFSHFGVNVLNYEEYRARSSTIVDMGYATPYADNGKIHVGDGQGAPEEVWAWGVSSSLFATLGVQPTLGRVFLDEERAPAGDFRYTEVAILSHRLWQRRFGADPDIVGKQIELDSGPSTIVGVMPPGFDLPPISVGATVLHRQTDVYLPMYYQAYQQPRRFRQVAVIGRLAPGVDISIAQSEMTLLADGLREAYPEDMSGWSVVVVPLRAALAENYGSGLYLLMGAVAFVLLVVCGNVANLLMVRLSGRSVEIAVRAAIGGGRIRLARMLMTETMLLALAGGIAGVLLAFVATDLLVNAIPADVPRASESGLDTSVLAFALGLSVLTGLVFGIVPALHASSTSLSDGLKIGMAGRSKGSGSAWRSDILVTGQVAMAVALLLGAGILAKSFLRLYNADPGYRAEGVLVANAAFGAHHLLTAFAGNADERTPERAQRRFTRQYQFTHEVIEAVKNLPGVISVASGSKPLSGGGGHWPLLIGDNPEPQTYTLGSYVTPDYFRTMDIPLLRGQLLPEWDGVNDMARYRTNWNGSCLGQEQFCVVIVSESLARAVWPGEDPIGQRIGIYDCCLTVIGVVGDANFRGVDDPPLFREFDTAFHIYMPGANTTFLIRTAGDPSALIDPVRGLLGDLEPEGILSFSTLESDIDASLARPRFYMVLIGLFATVAIGLAMVGLYGVIAHRVARRTREIGVRMALGADREDVLSMVLRQGLSPLVVGLVLGVAGATTLSRVLAGVLYGMEPLDPTLFLVLGATVIVVGALASYAPARRASRVAPMEALRYE